MHFTGIIAEYDPFHNGHAAQLAAVRDAGAEKIAVTLSAGSVQRGGLPVLPEPVRVAAALTAGADLVVALPAPYASATAEQFAAAGVRLLVALGCDTLAFGAETPNAAALLAAAQTLRDPGIDAPLRKNLATGVPYAAARAAAAEQFCPGTAALLSAPNNILGIEYCKAILAQNAAMEILPLPRLGAHHGGGAGEYAGTPMASASYLRGLPAVTDWKPFVPPAAYARYQTAAAAGQLLDPAKFSTAVLALLRGKTAAELGKVRGVSEGLEYRLAEAVRTAPDVPTLYDALKTKRYPHARLRRLVLDAALATPQNLPPVPFLHVLGARKAALPLLKNVTLPAGTGLADLMATGPEAAQVGTLHSKAVDFSALCRVKTGPVGLAFTDKAMIL